MLHGTDDCSSDCHVNDISTPEIAWKVGETKFKPAKTECQREMLCKGYELSFLLTKAVKTQRAMVVSAMRCGRWSLIFGNRILGKRFTRDSSQCSKKNARDIHFSQLAKLFPTFSLRSHA